MPTIPDSTKSISKAETTTMTRATESAQFQTGRVLTITAGHTVHGTRYLHCLSAAPPAALHRQSLPFQD